MCNSKYDEKRGNSFNLQSQTSDLSAVISIEIADVQSDCNSAIHYMVHVTFGHGSMAVTSKYIE